ncbi:PREDICTED: uncharacterized protein LOC106148548 isoform X2 [Chinchilla lanigera]|uniref:uncharacterized protein LOC106148548 isoform X2 n=1 Tax=Chinchilla lanigera TaxID=34839 RepID=UPI000696897C|nr:PREDICTED: uncharacterized protein LOC106148548 isoform X2 [Chinchilla lanigera]
MDKENVFTHGRVLLCHKKCKLQSCVGKWTHLETVMLGGINQTHEFQYRMASLIGETRAAQTQQNSSEEDARRSRRLVTAVLRPTFFATGSHGARLEVQVLVAAPGGNRRAEGSGGGELLTPRGKGSREGRSRDRNAALGVTPVTTASQGRLLQRAAVNAPRMTPLTGTVTRLTPAQEPRARCRALQSAVASARLTVPARPVLSQVQLAASSPVR